MIHIIIKKITCEDYEKCSDNIIAKIKKEYSNFNPFGETQNSTVTVRHGLNNHVIKIDILDNYTATKPTLKKLEDLL